MRWRSSPVAKDVGPPGPRILPGYTHEVVVKLGQPLGARVIVDLHGNPCEVSTSHLDRTADTNDKHRKTSALSVGSRGTLCRRVRYRRRPGRMYVPSLRASVPIGASNPAGSQTPIRIQGECATCT
jgi:hypothetical protein